MPEVRTHPETSDVAEDHRAILEAMEARDADPSTGSSATTSRSLRTASSARSSSPWAEASAASGATWSMIVIHQESCCALPNEIR